jgi:hypothetical protein
MANYIIILLIYLIGLIFAFFCVQHEVKLEKEKIKYLVIFLISIFSWIVVLGWVITFSINYYFNKHE